MKNGSVPHCNCSAYTSFISLKPVLLKVFQVTADRGFYCEHLFASESISTVILVRSKWKIDQIEAGI